MCDKYMNRLLLTRAPYWGPGPKPPTHPLTGNRTGDLSVRRSALNPLSHNSQGFSWKFLSHRLQVQEFDLNKVIST